MSSPTSSATGPTARRYFWQRFSPSAPTSGADLAALRRGIDREPGAVPALWPYYTTLAADGRLSPALTAEHVALTLFAIHQQSRSTLMHRDSVGLGTALLALKRSGQCSEEAVDRRFAAAATATSRTELAGHLRGLVGLLRGISQPLDYTALVRDLRDWQSPDRVAAVRRRWGGQYFAPRAGTRDTDTTTATANPEGTR